MHPSGLSPVQQAFALQTRFPDAKGAVKPGRLLWIGDLQPTPLGRSYRIQIGYRPRQPPEVRVLDALETRSGESLPHVYVDGTLCVYLPGEWNENMYLDESIVPWAAEWLANYEIWLATGETVTRVESRIPVGVCAETQTVPRVLPARNRPSALTVFPVPVDHAA
jgi:hypothetical protein